MRRRHAQKVSLWLEKHKDEITMFFLPPYSPQYNPDEYLNSDLKRTTGNHSMPRSENNIVKNIRSHMKSLQSKADKVKSFFRAPSVRCAVPQPQYLIVYAVNTYPVK